MNPSQRIGGVLLVIGLCLAQLGCDSGLKCEPSGPGLCACILADAGYCIEFNHDHDSFDATTCDDMGGEIEASECPTDNLIGSCSEADDCYDPTVYFYDNYDGSFENFTGTNWSEECEGPSNQWHGCAAGYWDPFS